MSELGGEPRRARAETLADEGMQDWARAWTIAMDALARVSVAAAATRDEAQLQAEGASALVGPFADWAIFDLLDGRWARAVAAREPDLALADLLLEVTAPECPLITSAMSRCAPVVALADDDESLLGRLPGGRTVIGALSACSAATAPIMNQDTPRGAVTIVRGPGRPGIGFVELGVLAQIGDLTNAAVERLAS
jgi:hypothetical protein